MYKGKSSQHFLKTDKNFDVIKFKDWKLGILSNPAKI